jgi:hypothetical protein
MQNPKKNRQVLLYAKVILYLKNKLFVIRFSLKIICPYQITHLIMVFKSNKSPTLISLLYYKTSFGVLK